NGAGDSVDAPVSAPVKSPGALESMTCSVMPSTAPLSTKDVSVSVGTRQLVSGLSVSFTPGEFVAVLGRNGCGKTLTLHTLAGLRKTDAGGVLLEGTAVGEEDR